MNQLTIVRTWIAADTAGNKDEYVQVFNIHDTIPPVIEIASDTLYMTSLEYATNGAGSNIVSITDNCGTALGDIVINKVEENGQVRYEYEVAMSDACGNVAIRHFVVVISENPPVVVLLYDRPDMLASVKGGVLPYEYAWSYTRPGSENWIPVESNDLMLDLIGIGMMRKVRVRVTDSQNKIKYGSRRSFGQQRLSRKCEALSEPSYGIC